MATIHRGMSAPGGERFELRGRFLAHVADLELLARLIVAGYLSGQDWEGSRFRLLHDQLLRQASLGRLSEVMKGMMADLGEEQASTWGWLPPDLSRLARQRNEWAHRAAPWAPSKDELTDEQAVRLLVKVDHGLANFGRAIQSIALGDEVTWPSEAHYEEAAEQAAPELVEDLRRAD
jgi:hypothetical protein